MPEEVIPCSVYLKKNQTASEKYFFSHYKQAYLTLAKPSNGIMCVYQKGVKTTA